MINQKEMNTFFCLSFIIITNHVLDNYKFFEFQKVNI